jgi:hypothetical protein
VSRDRADVAFDGEPAELCQADADRDERTTPAAARSFSTYRDAAIMNGYATKVP